MIFIYKSIGDDGVVLVERGEFDSRADLEASVRRRGRILAEARHDLGALVRSMFEARTIPRTVLIDFMAHLRSTLEMGIDFIGALQSVPQTFEDRQLRIAIRVVIDRVQKGFTFADAMEDSHMFTPLLVSSIRAGELAGSLPQVLAELERHLQGEQEVADTARRALFYPAVSIAAIVLSAAVIVFYALPMMRPIFPKQIPLPTRILLFFSDAGVFLWWLTPLLLVGAWIVYRRLGVEQRARLGLLFRRLPLLGKALRDLETTTLFMNFAVMLKSGIPIIRALELVAGSVRSRRLRGLLISGRERLQHGHSLWEIFLDEQEFPHIVPLAMRRNESLGQLDETFARLAQFLRTACERRLRLIATLLEPAVLVVGGVLLLGLSLAVLLPILRLTREIGGHG